MKYQFIADHEQSYSVKRIHHYCCVRATIFSGIGFPAQGIDFPIFSYMMIVERRVIPR
jgi:hypothetical protein